MAANKPQVEVQEAFVGVAKVTSANMENMIKTVESIGENIAKLLEQNQALKKVRIEAGLTQGKTPDVGNVQKVDASLKRLYAENKQLLDNQKKLVNNLRSEIGPDNRSQESDNRSTRSNRR